MPGRDQEQAELRVDAVAELALDVGLLDLDFAGVVGRGDRVLHLELADEARPLVEAIARRRARSGRRRPWSADDRRWTRVVELAVAEPVARCDRARLPAAAVRGRRVAGAAGAAAVGRGQRSRSAP